MGIAGPPSPIGYKLINMGTDPPGWGLGVGLTTPHRKKVPVRKPELWPRKGLKEVHYGGEGPNWVVVPMKK